MSIRVRKDVLKNAAVSALHYSKNIAFTDYSTCSMITGELAKVDMTIFSNLRVNGTTIEYTYRKPFDLFANAASCLEW